MFETVCTQNPNPLASIVSMGFELEEAGAALAAHGGDAQAAVDQLLSS